MRSILNISFRYKIPLWGSLLIVVTALAVSASLMGRAYDDVRQDLLVSSAGLAQTLAVTLFPAMLNDDVWRAFEIINAPLKAVSPDSSIRAELILVLDSAQKVYVSTNPQAVPMLTELAGLSPEHAMLAERIAKLTGRHPEAIELLGAHHVYVVAPIANEGARLGTLVIAHAENVILPRFWSAAWRGGIVGLLVLAVLLPINWYWGQRMAVPLVQLASRVEQLGRQVPDDLDPQLYAYRDELGRLFEAYARTLKELREKAALEREIVQSERLAAVGRLAAGMAHEINNPLGGMLTAIDTLKCHANMDARTLKTIALIERGLKQIKETVGAPLVEAKLKSRELTPQDIEDVRTLVSPQAHEKALRLGWHNGLTPDVALPAAPVRQILINLLLNAIQAAGKGGEVDCEANFIGRELRLAVANNGQLLSAEQMEHLFEPFSPHAESSHGLGLWVTYQIVRQFGGRIAAERDGERTRFVVRIPLGDRAWATNPTASA